MTSYFVGDQPGTIVVPLTALSLAADVEATAVSAALGGRVVGAGVSTDGQALDVSLPADAFPAAGLYPLTIQLTTTAGVTTYAVEDIAVQADDGWHTLASARDQWADAPREDAILFTLLSASRFQCEEFAPQLPADSTPPLRYRQAQLMQARALWQSTKSNGAGELGEGGFTVQVFPMDWTVKSLLRPRRGIPVVA